MFTIYDPRKKKDFQFKGLFGKKTFSTLENNTLLLYSDSEPQVKNSNIIFGLLKQFYKSSSYFLYIPSCYQDLVKDLRKKTKGNSSKAGQDWYITFNVNDDNFELVQKCYETLPSFEEWVSGAVKNQKENDFNRFIAQGSSKKEIDDFLKNKTIFDCLFLSNFDVPEVYLLFFNEEEFTDIISAIPLV